MNEILTKVTLAITDLKKNPMAVFGEREVCILNRNKPTYYTVSPERMAELLAAEDYRNWVAEKTEVSK